MNVAMNVRSDAKSAEALADDLFRPMGAKGVVARTAKYEKVIEALGRLISGLRDPDAEIYSFPPVTSRRQVEKSGYLMSFPNLLGCVCCLHGSEDSIRRAVDCSADGRDWTDSLSAADLVLNPAACYPVYPMVAARGPVPGEGLHFDVAADCFRREPSDDLDRFQSFRMREFVRIGSPDQIMKFREGWMAQARYFADSLGLPSRLDLANDPFFGRAGELMAASQKQQSLKFELLIPIHSAERPTACMSFNYHLDHFSEAWDLRDAAGRPVHSGCVAFGMDRLAVAMFATHGLNTGAWPARVRDFLTM
jgi:seryl-tRNA synthetase